ICLASIHSQFYRVQAYTDATGIPSNQAYNVSQASDGLIWVAHSNGVSTYDGINWYSFADSLKLPIYNTQIRSTEDAIWVYGQNEFEFVLMRYQNQTWDRIELPVDPDRFSHFDVKLSRDDQRLVLANSDEIYQYRPSVSKWEKITIPTDLSFQRINRAKYIGDKLYLVTEEKILSVTESGVKKEFADLLDSMPELVDIVQSTFDATFYILGRTWLMSITEKEAKLLKKDFLREGDAYLHELKYNSGSLYFRSATALHKYDLYTKTLTSFRASKYEVFHSGSNLYFDRENNLWVTSLRGVYKFNSFRFGSYTMENGLPENEVSAIHAIDDKTLFLGANNHFSIFSNNKFKSVDLSDSFVKLSTAFRRILDVTSHKGKIYFSATSIGLGILDSNYNLSWIHQDTGSEITSVMSDGDNLYTANSVGLLFKVDVDRKTLNRYPFQMPYIRRIKKIDNKLYLLSPRGMGILEGDSFKKITSKNSTYTNIYSIHQVDNRILLGTVGGLCEFVNDTIVKAEIWGQSITQPIYQILPVYKGIWFGTNRGIYSVNKKGMVHFGKKDGLIGNEINRNAMVKTNDGKVWIGTDQGLSFYDAHSDYNQSHIPVPSIVSIANSNHDILESTNGYNINSDQNTITINFRALSFYDETIVNYRVKLKGIDKDWIEIKDHRNNKRTYTNLPYGGPYEFYLQARNGEGEWSHLVHSDKIWVLYPFYLTWWFITLVVAVIVTITYIVNTHLNSLKNTKKLQLLVKEKVREIEQFSAKILKKNNRLNREINERKRMEKEREQFVKELRLKNEELERFTYTVSHDLKTPLITIKGYLGLIQNDIENFDFERLSGHMATVHGAADSMSELLNDLVEIMRIEKGVKELKAIPMKSVVDDVVDSLSTEIKRERITIRVNEELPVIKADPKRIREVVKNLID
ncbi:MAG: hypothetical protein KDD94_10730, partial [Calditrichaeota bacterium]|nr:hypothetical protein [Calditrichota bacterium]